MIPALDAIAAILPKSAPAPALSGDGTFAAFLPFEGEAAEEDEPVEAVTAEASSPPIAAQILLMPPQPTPLCDAAGTELPDQFGAMTDASPVSVSPAGQGGAPGGPETVGIDADPHLPEKPTIPDSRRDALMDVTEKVRVRHLPPQTAERADSAGRILFEGRHLAVMPQEPAAVLAGGGAAPPDGSDDSIASPEIAPVWISDGPLSTSTEPLVPSSDAALAVSAEGGDRSAPPVSSQIRHAVQSVLSSPVIHRPTDVATGEVPGRQIELRLDPAELGAVSIVLQGNEDALVVRITAERPETLDLMRRNSDQLLAELRAAGIGDAQMSFDMGRDPSHTNRSTAEAALVDAMEGPPPGPVVPKVQSAPIPVGDTGLFIRV